MTDLSESGQKRRGEILALVLEESRRINRRRQRRLRCSVAAATIAVVCGVVLGLWPTTESQNSSRRVHHTRDEHHAESSGFDLASYLVDDEVDDLREYLVETAEEMPPEILLGDSELLEILADHGHNDALVRADGRAWLVSAFVDGVNE